MRVAFLWFQLLLDTLEDNKVAMRLLGFYLMQRARTCRKAIRISYLDKQWFDARKKLLDSGLVQELAYVNNKLSRCDANFSVGMAQIWDRELCDAL